MEASNTRIEECWWGVTDPKKRKQLQDRLAQRARRKRLAEAKKQSAPGATSKRPRRASSKEATSQSNVPEVSSSLNFSPTLIPEGISQALNPLSQPHPLLSSIGDYQHLSVPCITVYNALLTNGRLLGISCSNTGRFLSKPTLDAPVSLQPTPIQLTTIHASFIDRFPFPRMRNNLISLTGLINEEEFVEDLFMMHSFSIVPGHMSWDPQGWRIGEEFKEKWGYLFF